MNDDITKMLQATAWPEPRYSLATDIMAEIDADQAFPVWQLPASPLTRIGLGFAFIACMVAGYLCAPDDDATPHAKTVIATPYGQHVGLSYLI